MPNNWFIHHLEGKLLLHCKDVLHASIFKDLLLIVPHCWDQQSSVHPWSVDTMIPIQLSQGWGLLSHFKPCPVHFFNKYVEASCLQCPSYDASPISVSTWIGYLSIIVWSHCHYECQANFFKTLCWSCSPSRNVYLINYHCANKPLLHMFYFQVIATC